MIRCRRSPRSAHTEPAALTRLVRGELDWIVMKALEKDRNRRYETANGFSMDVQRYLADEPVQACPPSKWYRVREVRAAKQRVGRGCKCDGFGGFDCSRRGRRQPWMGRPRAAPNDRRKRRIRSN